MKRIIITGSFLFTEDQLARLHALGDVYVFDKNETAAQWLRAVEGADVILSDGDFLLENLGTLKNVFVTYPYIELGGFNSGELSEQGVVISNTKGSNKHAIVEWVTFMTLALYRNFPNYLNITENSPFRLHESLQGKRVLIVGKGSIGTEIGTVLQALGMEVDYHRRGDNLLEKAATTQLVVNALNCNSSSKNLLDETFFNSLQPGSHFISFVRQHTYDLAALIQALNNGILSGAAIDCDPEEPFGVENEFYQTCLKHNKILVTPHIAFATTLASANGKETAIQNIEAFCKGVPQNVVNKI